MICKECGEDLKHYALGLCKRCYWKQYRETHKEETKDYMAAHRDQNRESSLRYDRARGAKPASENKQCTSFLGVHVAERVLSKVFKDVKRMPPNYAGYDFICNKGKKIDVKSACTDNSPHQTRRWVFRLNKNQIADFFLFLTFDNREDLTPLSMWLIPGNIINHLVSLSISESTLLKWDEYKLCINRVTACCDTMKQTNKQKVI